jgi:hypothetical protein
MKYGSQMHADSQPSGPCVRLKVVDPPPKCTGLLGNEPSGGTEMWVAIGTERGPGLMGRTALNELLVLFADPVATREA